MTRIGNFLYRPTENHVGAVYRLGRFHRFVDPDRLAFTIPWLETIAREIRLDMRTCKVSLKDIYTRERIAVNVDFKVFYFIDLRAVDQERLIQVLRFPTEEAWDEIVRTAVNDVVRNQIFISKAFNELNSKEGRASLKSAMSGEVAERVRGFGILLNPKFGVSLVNLQPNEEFRKALMEESAAETLGSAAVSRLNPLLEKLVERKQEKAIYTLIMQIASAVVKNGEIPDVIFPNPNEYPAGGLAHADRQGPPVMPNLPGFLPSSRRPRSTASDTLQK